jgi:hypothetical protein
MLSKVQSIYLSCYKCWLKNLVGKQFGKDFFLKEEVRFENFKEGDKKIPQLLLCKGRFSRDKYEQLMPLVFHIKMQKMLLE